MAGSIFSYAVGGTELRTQLIKSEKSRYQKAACRLDDTKQNFVQRSPH